MVFTETYEQCKKKKRNSLQYANSSKIMVFAGIYMKSA
jgi:hypothetical protein